MLILTDVIPFDSAEGMQPRTDTRTYTVARRVKKAGAILTGYSAEFTHDDHHFGRLVVAVEAAASQNQVTVTATFGLRDKNGDDSSAGEVRFCVLVELEDVVPPILG
jgi:hypothetical protein